GIERRNRRDDCTEGCTDSVRVEHGDARGTNLLGDRVVVRLQLWDGPTVRIPRRLDCRSAAEYPDKSRIWTHVDDVEVTDSERVEAAFQQLRKVRWRHRTAHEGIE